MGPHFFKCGKQISAKAEGAGWKCFNGAALFQVRKAFLNPLFRQMNACFNGAALFQVRKDGLEAKERNDGFVVIFFIMIWFCREEERVLSRNERRSLRLWVR